MLKIREGIIIILIIIFFGSNCVWANNFTIDADAAILMEAKSGQIIFSKNENKELPIASLTKIMTVLVALEKVEFGESTLQDEVYITSSAEAMGGSQIWLAAGERLTLKELLKATLLPSANDAAVAVANYIGGGEQNFVKLMNQQAQSLGLNQTYFINSTGLTKKNRKNYSTAEEIALITKSLVNHHGEVLNWTDQRVDYINNQQPIYNTNKLIGYYNGADGLQTGWTEASKYCLVATAKRDNRRLITVILGAKSKTERVNTACKLLDYGFGAFKQERLINKGEKITTLKIKQGQPLKVPLIAKNSLSALVKIGAREKVKEKIKVNTLKAPVDKNEKVGKIIYSYNNNDIGTVPLVTAEKIKKANIWTLLLRWLSKQGDKLIKLIDISLAN